jgi:hypothetical protein
LATLYCECDHSVWSDLWWREEGPDLVFIDNQTSSPSYGKQVTDCPGCGRELRLERLRSENYPVRG